MKTSWAMVRFDAETKRRLEKFLASWRHWTTEELWGPSRKFHKKPSLCDAVAELLDRIDKHRKRSKRSRTKPADQVELRQAELDQVELDLVRVGLDALGLTGNGQAELDQVEPDHVIPPD